MIKTFLLMGSIGGLLSVSLGAFAAHALKAQLSEKLLNTFQTAVEYQFFHSLVLILIAILLTLKPKTSYFKVAGCSIATGILLFSGSLYYISLTATSYLGIVTPIGGVAFLVGWTAMMLGIWKSF